MRTPASGHRGVYWNKEKKKWKVVVSINGYQTFGGYYLDKEEARDAQEKLHKRLLDESP